tara:strand:- start:61 stop:975 length:915 start_codon:yes stop_codon:yes gene_type:complete
MSKYIYDGPLNGGYAIQDKEVTAELEDFCMSTYEWHEFFAANGVTDHREKFLETFNRWIRKSKLNVLKGLEAFPYVSQTNGTSEAFSMFMQRHSNKTFKFYKGDFMMHKVASNNIGCKWEWIYNYGQIKEGDAVIVSCPFSDTGAVRSDMHELLNWCTHNNVPVLIDMAYFGMCYGINIDLDSPCVEEVTFSLGKTFPIIGARAGIRLQREEIDDPVLFANQHGIVNNFGALIGEHAMRCWGPDYIANKYMKAQLIVCNKLELKPTNCIVFALSNHETHEQFNRGNDLTRLCISKLLVEEYERT